MRLSSNRLVRASILAGVVGAVAIAFYLFVLHVYALHDATGRQLFQWDASNALGPAAFRGGWRTAALGLLMHLIVSLVWAAIFVAVVSRVPSLIGRPITTGALFGVIVWIAMRGLVALNGRAAAVPLTTSNLINLLIAHVIFFGIPVALVVRRILTKPSNLFAK